MQSRQQGFTLVELIVVIVILGILAATALPKFIDVSSDARTGVMKGVEGAMRGANLMVYGKAAAQGKLGPAESVTINGASVSTVCGYLALSEMTGQLQLTPDEDFTITPASGVVQHKKASDPDECQVTYVAPPLTSGACDANSVPTYTPDYDKC